MSARTQAQYPVILVVMLSIGWASWYLFDTPTRSTLLIRPLVALLVISGLLVLLVGSKSDPEDAGLADRRTVTTILYAGAFVVSLPFLGFVIPSILFVNALAHALGSRPVWLPALSAFVVLVLFGGFAWTLSVPLPLWPDFG